MNADTEGPNYELLREGTAIVDGIPEEQFNLSRIMDKSLGEPANSFCGTLGCALGWMGMHPKFQELGFSTDGPYPFMVRGEATWDYEIAGAKLFNISPHQARQLFSPRYLSIYDTNKHIEPMSDKELFNRRVRAFLREQGQPVAERQG